MVTTSVKSAKCKKCESQMLQQRSSQSIDYRHVNSNSQRSSVHIVFYIAAGHIRKVVVTPDVGNIHADHAPGTVEFADISPSLRVTNTPVVVTHNTVNSIIP